MTINYTHPKRLNAAAFLAAQAKRDEDVRRLLSLYIRERSSSGGSSRRVRVLRKGETVNLTALARTPR